MAIGGVSVVPVGGGSGMTNDQKPTNFICDDIAGRDGLILSPGMKGSTAFVKDATADETVDAGWALYSWDGEAWNKTSEGESLEVAQLLLNYYNKAEIDNLLANIDSGSNDILLSSISGFASEPIDVEFTDSANNANIEYVKDTYKGNVCLLSTSSNEPRQLPMFIIPAGITSLKFKHVYIGEDGTTYNSESVVHKGELKKMTDNNAWSNVSAFDVGTDILPASGSTPQIYETTIPLETLGLAPGDVVQMTTVISSTSTWANDIASFLYEVYGVA